MKVLLLFPPQFNPTQPYLSIPSLTARLRQEGVQVAVRDLNAEFYQWALSRTAVRDALCRLRGSDGAHAAVKDLARRMGGYLERNVEVAREFFRTEGEFYDLGRYHWARSVVSQALAVVGAGWGASSLSLNEFRCAYDYSSSNEAATAARDPDSNVIHAFVDTHVLESMRAEHPDLVGLSVSSPFQVIGALTIAHLLKAQRPDVPVVLGGGFFSRALSGTRQPSGLTGLIDGIVLYEGEESLVQLCDVLTRRDAWPSVPNLVRSCNGHLVGPNLVHREDMRKLPTPDFRDLPLDLYLSPKPVLPLLTSRGCYWHQCSFCTSYLSYGSRYSARPRERILEDLDTLASYYGSSDFFLADQAVPPTTLQWLADNIRRLDQRVHFYGQTRCDGQFDGTWLPRLREAGCTKLYFGIESGSASMVRRMSKGIELNHAREVLRLCTDAGIAVHLFFLVGFPGETAHDRAQTLEFLKSIPEVTGFPGFSMNFAPFGLEPASAVGSDPERYGVEETWFPEAQDLPTHCLYSCVSGPPQQELSSLVKETEDRAMALVEHRSYPTAGPHCSLYLSRTPLALAATTGQKVPFPEFDVSMMLRPRAVGGASVGTDDQGRPVLYWPETGFTRLLSREAALMLELCTGEVSLEQICAGWVQEGRGKALHAWLVAKQLWEAGLLTT